MRLRTPPICSSVSSPPQSLLYLNRNISIELKYPPSLLELQTDFFLNVCSRLLNLWRECERIKPRKVYCEDSQVRASVRLMDVARPLVESFVVDTDEDTISTPDKLEREDSGIEGSASTSPEPEPGILEAAPPHLQDSDQDLQDRIPEVLTLSAEEPDYEPLLACSQSENDPDAAERSQHTDPDDETSISAQGNNKYKRR